MRTLKNKEDLQRLREIKRNLAQSFLEIKTLKQTIKALKAERNTIKNKYVKVQPLPVPTC